MQCETPFTPKENQRGSEQKYCSLKCRNIASQQRMIEKIKENAIQETRQNTIVPENHSKISGHGDNTQQRTDNYSSDVIRLMESNFETKGKTYELELKNNYLLRDIEELKKEIANLEMEIEELESSDENNGMLGGIMKQFKQDPVTAISFATELINNIIKPKTNA